MLEWLDEYQPILWPLAAASVVMFVAGLIVIPTIIVRLDANYFAHETRPHSRWAHRSAPMRVLMLITKNMLGIVLVMTGILLLALPGQGLLTILVGIMLLDFPRKYQFQRWLVSRRAICRPINWLRRRAGREPLKLRY